MATSNQSTPDTILSGDIVSSHTTVTFGQLCRSCGMDADWVILLVDEGILDPVRSTDDNARTWYFRASHIQRARTAARLHRDLSVNVAGLGLALDLLDEIETLHARLDAARERHVEPR